MNLRPPGSISTDFLREQDILLQEESSAKGVVKLDELPTIADETSKDITPQDAPARNLVLWQGDITRLAADGIVNAANSAMLGCFAPCHGCIDNAIHSAAGLQLREACAQLMKQQGHPEPTGQAKITPAYNLPSKFVLHTVGPIIPSDCHRTKQKPNFWPPATNPAWIWLPSTISKALPSAASPQVNSTIPAKKRQKSP